MPNHKSKKRKTSSSGAAPFAEAPQITDPRFTNIQSDPRYRLPGKKHKVKLDKRFSQALKQDDDFNRRAKVDRYGRPLDTDSERTRLKRKYEFEEEDSDDDVEEEEEDGADDDDEVQRELKRVGGVVDTTRDLLREGRDDGEDSSSESSSDEDEEEVDVEEAELAPQTQDGVPEGEVSSRLAVVNLDWDNIRAEDLMAVFSSFLDPNGKLLKVAVYPSEFGKERMQREEMEGPPKEIFAAAAAAEREDNEFENFGSESEGEEDDEALKEKLIRPDDGSADFDSAALRRYQLDRLRYFYAILTFSSPTTAKHIYDAVDGTEYLSTANFFDLRFVPDDTDFSSDTPREQCTAIPSNYKPNDFVTDALQHSKVKLTWDAEDNSRKEAAAQAFRSKDIRDLDDVDLAAYIGSDSEDEAANSEEEEEDDATTANGTSRKETERQKMRSLLGLAAEPAPSSKSKKDRGPVGNVEITFSAGLTSNNNKNTDDPSKNRSVFENSPEPEETTIEKYVRKEKERKARRREKARATREGRTLPDDASDDAASNDDENDDGGPRVVTAGDGEADADDDDLGFNDPFFTDPSDPATAKAAASEKKKIRKEERLQKRREREAEEAASAKQRRELELLMADDAAGEGDGDKKGPVRHFDMREVEKAEKRARKEAKRNGKKKDGNGQAQGLGQDDAFKMDTEDPRFAGRLFGNHEFAIDPSNPRFKGTNGMQALLEEGRRKRKGGKDGPAAVSEKAGRKGKGKERSGATLGEAGGKGDDVSSLLEKIKRRKA